MGNGQHLFIVLPCYNEEKSIKDLVKKINETCLSIDYTIMAVDDGSRDKTLEALRRLESDFPMIVLKHLINLGIHEALHTGLSKAAQMAEPNDIIIVMDADLTHDPSYIPIMISNLKIGFDVVIASRYAKAGKQLGVPFHRAILSQDVCFFLKYLARLPAKDITCGYRCYKMHILKKITQKYGKDFIDSKGFEVSVELLVKAHRAGARLTEIPIILDYSRRRGKSKMIVSKTILDYFRLARNLSRW